MHNANSDIYQLVIEKLEQYFVPLTQEDKNTIRLYINNQNGEIIKHHMNSYYILDIKAMYEFLYRNSGINGLLEVISDKNRFQQDVIQKAEIYQNFSKQYSFLNDYNKFSTSITFQDLCDYSLFVYSECEYGKLAFKSNIRQESEQTWMLASNNCSLIKSLFVNGNLENTSIYDIYKNSEYLKKAQVNGDECEALNIESVYDLYKYVGVKSLEEKLKDVQSKTNCYIQEKTKVVKDFDIVDFSQERNRKHLVKEPDSLLQLAKVAVAVVAQRAR